MKAIKLTLACMAVASLAISCSEQTIMGHGEGSVTLSTTINTDMRVVSRADAADYAESTILWLSNDKGVIYAYNGINEIPTSPVPLVSGHYCAEAWAGDSVPASWDKKWFHAIVPFDVTDGASTRVEVPLKIANVGVRVEYEDAVATVLKNCSMTVSHSGGELVFEGDKAHGVTGYFMLPSTDRTLHYVLTGTQLDGSTFTAEADITNALGGTEYVLTVKYKAGSTDIGGAYFVIELDHNEFEVNTSVEVMVPPTISGYGFDITSPINAEQGAVGRRSIYIASATTISHVELESDQFSGIINGTDVDLKMMNDDVRASLEAAGINFRESNPEGEQTLIQINFEESYTDALELGEYRFAIKATDRGGRVGVANFVIKISDAPVVVQPVDADDLSNTTSAVTVKGTVVKEGVSTVGFNYRKVGTAAWSWAEGVVASRSLAIGTEYSARLTGLEAGTNYEFVATADDFVSGEVMTFTTEAAEQLPNSGFENWSSNEKIQLLYGTGEQMFWDSGNHGAVKFGESITTPEGTIKHSGNYSAKLYSTFKGVGSIGAFAAGNAFTGKYLDTDGTNGILGWGRPFSGRPSAMKVWIHYTPRTVEKKAAKYGLKEGDLDLGIVYCALMDDYKESYTFKGTTYSWPVIVRTKAAERNLFDKNSEHVIAYGEREFTEATSGDALVEITIPLDYRRTDIRPSNIIVVFSASKFGDYFTGGEGSTMYVDDIEMVYE